MKHFVVSILPSENKRLLQESKLELKKSKRKDYYKVLSIHKSASEEEIKKAYRKHALLHHPGKFKGAFHDSVSFFYDINK